MQTVLFFLVLTMSGDLAGEEDAEGVCDEDGGRRSRVCRSVHGMRLCCTLQFMECDALSWWNATLKSKTRVRGHVAVLYDCGCVGVWVCDLASFSPCLFVSLICCETNRIPGRHLQLRGLQLRHVSCPICLYRPYKLPSTDVIHGIRHHYN